MVWICILFTCVYRRDYGISAILSWKREDCRKNKNESENENENPFKVIGLGLGLGLGLVSLFGELVWPGALLSLLFRNAVDTAAGFSVVLKNSFRVLTSPLIASFPLFLLENLQLS